MNRTQQLREAHLLAAINGWHWLERLTAKKLKELHQGAHFVVKSPIR